MSPTEGAAKGYDVARVGHFSKDITFANYFSLAVPSQKALPLRAPMPLKKRAIPFAQSRIFSKLFLDYLSGGLKEFYDFEPAAGGIYAFTEKHGYETLDRQLLVNELRRQNGGCDLSAATKENIGALADKNTYTIITGHQLCLATGPLFFIYKILSVIRIAGELNSRYGNKKFVPVYWMAGEDHDVAEINHVVLFNKKYEWQTQQKGRVGEFSTAGIDSFLQEIKAVLGDNAKASHIFSVLENAYAQATLAEATRYLVNELFGSCGLVIVDGNSQPFKQLFIDEIKRDAFENFAFKAVESTNKQLKAKGYEPQVSPREINSFLAGPGFRERIVSEGARYKILNTEIEFDQAGLAKRIEEETEKFSPNVVLRPLYQQKILPNAAYVGGPGEIAYWLQYKQLFAEACIPYPAIVPRSSVLYIEKGLQDRLNKLKLKPEDFFADKAQLLKSYALQQEPFDLEKEMQLLRDLYAGAKSRISHVDKTLEAAAEAELHKALKGVETLEQKAIRAIKQRSEQSLKQVEAVFDRSFPGGEPQERVENFLRFYISNPHFIEEVKQAIDPFAHAVQILWETESDTQA